MTLQTWGQNVLRILQGKIQMMTVVEKCSFIENAVERFFLKGSQDDSLRFYYALLRLFKTVKMIT